jgi:hypothetical protein
MHGPCPDHESYPNVKGKRALLIATNHAVLGSTGQPTGVYAEELTTPYYAFLDAGLEVDIASPKGGRVPVDPLSLWYSLRSVDDDRYLVDLELQSKMEGSLAIGGIEDMGVYDVVFSAGGWGASFDLGHSADVARQVKRLRRLCICMGPHFRYFLAGIRSVGKRSFAWWCLPWTTGIHQGN